MMFAFLSSSISTLLPSAGCCVVIGLAPRTLLIEHRYYIKSFDKRQRLRARIRNDGT